MVVGWLRNVFEFGNAKTKTKKLSVNVNWTRQHVWELRRTGMVRIVARVPPHDMAVEGCQRDASDCGWSETLGLIAKQFPDVVSERGRKNTLL